MTIILMMTMKRKIKRIPKPDLVSARKLTPLQLNALRFDKRHTILTPERIAALKQG